MDFVRKLEQINEALYPPPEIQVELNRTVAAHLRHILSAFIILYLSLAASALFWDGSDEPRLLTLAVTSALGCLVLRVLISGRRPTSHRSHLCATLLAFSLVLDCIVYVHYKADPTLITPVFLVMTIAGFLFLSTAWFIVAVFAVVAGWMAGVALLFSNIDWPVLILPMLAGTLFASVVFTIRMQTMVKLEMLRTQALDHRSRLENALVSAHHELEERKRTEAALETARLTYRVVTDLTSDLIFTTDRQGRVQYMNDRARQILARAGEWKEGMTLLPFLHPDEVEAGKDAFGQVVRRGQKLEGAIFRLKQGDGWRLIEWSASPVTEADGRHSGIQCVGRDVTDQLEAHRALRESEERWRLLVDMSPDFILRLDPDLKISYINRVGPDYDGPEVLGAYAPDFGGPKMAPSIKAMLQSVFETGRTSEFEFPYNAHGETVWYLVRIAPLRRGATINSLMVVVTDVTQSKKVEEKMRESEARYRLLAENVTDVIWTSDLNLRFTYVSPSARTVFGYSSDELRSVSVAGILTSDSLKKAWEILRGELQKEQQHAPLEERTTTLELESIRKDGSTFWTEIRVTFLRDKNGNATGLLGVTRDVSERRTAEEELRISEERYRLLAENATDFIWTSDLNFNLTFVSPAGLRMMGYDPEEAPSLRPDQMITPESFKIASEAFLREMTLENDASVDPHRTATLELESIRKDGSTFWTEVRVTFMRDKTGKPVGIVGVSRDITERRQAEEVKERLEAQLLQSQKLEAIGTLAGGIAHDFNNLLAAILGYATMMKSRVEPDHEFFKGCDIIERAAERGRELTQQLLGFARKGKLQNTGVDINRTIQEVVNLLSRTINKSISMELQLAAEPVVVQGDPSQMQQVLLNLAVNAKDAMTKGGTLAFTTGIVDLSKSDCDEKPGLSAGSYAFIQVSDTGEGIEPGVQDRIFEPFFTTKEQGKGSGMGLAMVYGIIKNHQGEIEVESEPGKGTAFRIYLPRSRRAGEMTPSPDAAEPKRGQGKVLVVDDEEIVRQMVSDMLIHLGYDVVTANDGQEAVDFYQAHGDQIDLVLLDMIMPRMGGRDCFRHLKQMNPEIRAVLSTGYSRDETAQQTLEEGMLDFIQKPYRIGRLSEVVSKAIDGLNGHPGS